MPTFLNTVVRALSGAAAAQQPAQPSATIANGTVHGSMCASNHNAAEFRAIPYAKPPTGNLRFAPPQAYDEKFPKGTLNATQPAPSCIQFGVSGKEAGQTSEDCLYVDVWKPTNATNKSNLPVRVFVYGGSNTDGGISDAEYDGCAVAAKDAVMVSINYRLGPLGFLALDSAGISGNQAIQDIVQGLEWVQSNIASFGGSPKKVLLHGQSAGAVDAFTVATLPQAPKLMSAFISESGGGRHAPLNTSAQALGKQYAANLQCRDNDANCLRSKNVADLTKSFTSLPLLNAKSMSAVAVDGPADARFTPYVDGKVVATQPADQGVRVPAIFGTNAYEGTLFAMAQFAKNPKGIQGATEQDYTNFLNQNFGSQAGKVEQRYPLSAFKSTPAPAFYAISEVITDSSFFCPASRALNTADSKKVPVWTYQFATTPKCSSSQSVAEKDMPSLGATHGAEIPYVLGMTSRLPYSNGSCSMSDAETKISTFMQQAWTEMANAQKPVTNAGQWPAYIGANKPEGLMIKNTTQATTLNYTVCDFWMNINAVQVADAKNGTNATAEPKPKVTTITKEVAKATPVIENGKTVTKEVSHLTTLTKTVKPEAHSTNKPKSHATTITEGSPHPTTITKEVAEPKSKQTKTEKKTEKMTTITETGAHHTILTTKVAEPEQKTTHKKPSEHKTTVTETGESGKPTTITKDVQPSHKSTATADAHAPKVTNGAPAPAANGGPQNGTSSSSTTSTASATNGAPSSSASAHSNVLQGAAMQNGASSVAMIGAALVAAALMM